MKRAASLHQIIPVLAVITLLCIPLATLRAQTESAKISGIVTDSSGAVVAGAQILLDSVERGTSLTASTNGNGLYVFPAVEPGQYRMSARKDGFKQVDVLGITINVQDRLEENFHLVPGSVSESVTVSDSAPLMNTTDASVSTVIDRNFAENMPLNGRSFQTLIDLTPGVVVVPGNERDNGQFSVNGQRATSNYWMLDGVSANFGVSAGASVGRGNGLAGASTSFSTLGGTNGLVSVDAMQEFRIQTSTFAPEFGRTPGAQISIATRSGTNQFHGTAFEYFRNDVLDANDWFNTAVAPALPKARERQNDFGGTVGGPVIKDRTFFFFSYEGLRLRLPTTTLSTTLDTNPADPHSRQYAVSSIQPYVNIYPLPNGPEVLDSSGNHQGIAEFNASYSNPASLDSYSLRIDHKLSDKWSLFGRYSYSPSSLAERGPLGSPLNNIQHVDITTQLGTLGLTSILSPTVSNDLRFNYSRVNSSSQFIVDSFGGAVPPAALPFPSPYNTSNSAFALYVFSIDGGNPWVEGLNGRVLQQQLNIVDGLTVQRGVHSFKVGVDFRRLTPRLELYNYILVPLFVDVPSLIAGNPLETFAAVNFPTTFLFRNLGLYAQDTWRVTSRLSLTYGLRWDTDFSPGVLAGPKFLALTNFDPNNLSSIAPAPAGTRPYSTRYGNVAPRVGLAYQVSQNPSRQTVIRAGFGSFYDLASSEAGEVSGTGYPFASSTAVFTSFPLATPLVPPPPSASQLGEGVTFAFDPKLKQPYTLQWNGAIEQALGQQQTVSVSYVGALGRNLLRSVLVNNPSPAFSPGGQLTLATNGGASNYNALQIQFQRRLSHNLQALSSYTWSHSIDNASAGSYFNGSDVAVPGLGSNANRGPSDFDIRNSFSAGVTYDIPTPKRNAFVNAILRGWSTQNFVLARSASPVDVTENNFAFLSTNVRADIRPDLVPGQPLYLFGSQYPGGKAFNPAAFTDPPLDPSTHRPLRSGDVPRNFLRGFGAAQWDFAVHRDFPIRESLKLQFRAEMFNVLNHPNFGPPSGAFGSAQFGVSTQMFGQSLNNGNLGAGSLSPLYQIGGPRSIQFALKLVF